KRHRRSGRDGEARAPLLEADAGKRHRGVGLSARLALLLRRPQPRGHHAIPGKGLTVMIHSRLVLTKATPLATRGLVAAEHPAGARIGAEILERGGNAVDAAVATAFAMPVVEPFMSTIAGAGTMLIHVAKTGETVCLDFNGNAPMAAHPSIYKLIGGVATYALFAWPRVENDANV